MSEQADVEERDDEELQLEDGVEAEHEEGSEGADEAEDDEVGDTADDELDDFTFDGEAAPASRGDDSGLIKQLRSEIRKRDQQLAQLRTGAQPQTIEVGEKPTIDGCDFDQEKFEAEFEAWQQRKAQAETQQSEANKQAEAANAAFAEKLTNFGRQKAALKVKDFDAAEEVVAASLSQVQAAILIKAPENTAALTYALGRHPQKLATIAAISDPIEFTAALVKLEGTMKNVKRTRTPPEPDRPERGSGRIATATDKELERLEKEAAQTNDRTKVVAYRKKLKSQGRA
jgi:hypothetical protein